MKSTLWVMSAAAVLAGCSVNGSAPTTSWGKNDVSMLQYRTDASECTLLAVTLSPDENGARTAGGISGQNATVPQQGPSPSVVAGGTPPSGGPGNSGGQRVLGGNTYRDNATPDFVNRAAAQQTSQEMAAQRARHEALKSCLARRGYTEFVLTSQQRATLSKLPQGSDERREYLYRLGIDPEVLATQAVPRKSPGS